MTNSSTVNATVNAQEKEFVWKTLKANYAFLMGMLSGLIISDNISSMSENIEELCHDVLLAKDYVEHYWEVD